LIKVNLDRVFNKKTVKQKKRCYVASVSEKTRESVLPRHWLCFE